MVQKLLDMIRNRAKAEYDTVLDRTSSRQRDELTTALEQSKTELEIQNYDDMRAYLLNRGYFYLERDMPSFHSGRNFLLGKIIQQGIEKSKNYDYNWYVIETKNEDFEGVDVFENIKQGKSKVVYHYLREGIVANQNVLRKIFGEYWDLFNGEPDLSEIQMKRMRSSLLTIFEYKFVASLLREAQAKPNDDKTRKQIFIKSCIEEILPIELFNSYPIRIDSQKLPEEEIEFRIFLSGLKKCPSYYTLFVMINSPISTARGKGAKKIFDLFERNGYGLEWFKTASLNQIKRTAQDISSIHQD